MLHKPLHSVRTYIQHVHRVKHKTPVKGLSAQPGSSTIISYSDHNMYSWTAYKFVVELISMGCTVKELAHTTHPIAARSIIVTTDDAVVRLVSPVKCHVITTALLPVTSSVVCVAAAAHSSMFSLPPPPQHYKGVLIPYRNTVHTTGQW